MISLRKINTLLIIIIAVMLLTHGVLSLLYMYGIINHSPNFQITGRRLFYPIVAHIIISLYLYFKDKSKGVNRYPNLISDTRQQMITGIMIIVFASLHILGYSLHPLSAQSSFYFSISIVFFADRIRELNDIPDDIKLVVGIGIGYADEDHPLNQPEAPRNSPEEFTRFFD